MFFLMFSNGRLVEMNFKKMNRFDEMYFFPDVMAEKKGSARCISLLG